MNPMRRMAFSMVRNARTLAIAPRPRGRLDGRLLALLHARRLALQLAQEIQLGAADLRGAHHFDLVDDRRVQREDALDALPERHLAHGERGPGAAAVHANHHAFEHLDAFLVALADLDMDTHRVARLDRRARGELRALDGIYGNHQTTPSLVAPTNPPAAGGRPRPAARRTTNPAGGPGSGPALPPAARSRSQRGARTAAPAARPALRTP